MRRGIGGGSGGFGWSGRGSDEAGGSGGMGDYVRRITQINQMDFQSAFSLMVNLCFDPRAVYRSTIMRKQIKNQWSRDDPAFLAILFVFMLVASVSYATAFGFQSFSHFVKIIFSAVLVDFLGLGLVISTLYWFITNNYMRIRRVHVADQKVEWLYAFDVHCNSFFPLFIILYVIQFFLSPVLIRSTSIIATILGNSLYLLACSYYHYISFLGYDALPFLGHTSRLLAPIPALIVVFLLANVFNINISYHVLKYYFS